MRYILLISFVLCVNSEPENILIVYKNEESLNSEQNCYGSANLKEGEAAFIDFKVDYSTKKIENCVRRIGDEDLEIKEVEKTNFYTRYQIKNVTSSMHGEWECAVGDDYNCIINIQVVTNDKIVSVNKEKFYINRNKTDAYDGYVTYRFIKNELTQISFYTRELGNIKIEQTDDGISTGYINENEIYLYVKLTRNHDGKYIDCFYQLHDQISIVRIFLEQRELDPSLYQRDWKLEINRLPLHSRSTYHYILGDILNVSCEASKGGYNMALTGKLPSQVACPKEGFNYTLVILNFMNTAGLQGLQSRNILYLYPSSKYHLVIHYEYKSDDHLNISWLVLSKIGMRNIYEVTWKDKAVMSPFEVTTKAENHFNLSVPTIKLHDTDDRSVIAFVRTDVDGYNTLRRETSIILHSKTNNDTPKASKFQGELVFYTIVGAGSILIIILLASLCLIIRKKMRAPKNTSPEQMCGNLLSDDSSVSIPPQWNSYTEINKNEPSYMEINDLYAKPMPKTLKQDGTYANSSSSEEHLYSDIKRYSETNNKFTDNKGYVNIIE